MTTKVYAKCHGSPSRYPATDGIYLQTMFEGTRSQCATWIRYRVRNGLPTHFLTTSKLDHDAATRRYV